MPPPPQTPQHATPQNAAHHAYGAGATGGNGNNSNNNNAFLNTVLNSSSSTPSRNAVPRGGGGVTSAPTQFSVTQRSAQARGKEYNVVGRSEESYESRQRREEAGRILESMEMLIWWSAARNESIPQTRHHFQNVVLGIEEFDRDVVWKEEWEVEERGMGLGMGSPRSAKGKERERRRVSSGLGAA